jgi:membrane protease YdiL (CAAX protease family)
MKRFPTRTFFALGFGWLYRRRGLESAISAHFVADIVLRVLGHAVL